jgi:hypothetical protein
LHPIADVRTNQADPKEAKIRKSQGRKKWFSPADLRRFFQ